MKLETRMARLETACLHIIGLDMFGIIGLPAVPAVTHLIHQSAMRQRPHATMIMAQIAFARESIGAHGAPQGLDPVQGQFTRHTLRRLGDGVSSLVT
jgi:hypothetical protein